MCIKAQSTLSKQVIGIYSHLNHNLVKLYLDIKEISFPFLRVYSIIDHLKQSPAPLSGKSGGNSTGENPWAGGGTDGSCVIC